MLQAEGALGCPHTLICTFQVKQWFLRRFMGPPLASAVKGATWDKTE